MSHTPFSTPFHPDCESYVRCLHPGGRSKRVHNIELGMDTEISNAIVDRFGLCDDLSRDDEFYAQKRLIRVQRFLGYDYVNVVPEGLNVVIPHLVAEDTASLKRPKGRTFVNEQTGPITNWQQFEQFAWPDPAKLAARSLEWFQKNLPDDMCIVGRGVAHYAEYLSWLMGYETLCYALYEQRDLVEAIYQRTWELDQAAMKLLLQFDRVKVIFGSDDMGFRTGTLISPDDLRQFVLPGHQRVAALAHDAGRPYILHCCGKIDSILEDLIQTVRIDAKHSYEDVIQPVTEFHAAHGHRLAALGGIDVDFLCRSDEAAVRQRVRATLDQLMPRGGYCLGTGNTVANYIPLENYLAMLDEGRRWTA